MTRKTELIHADEPPPEVREKMAELVAETVVRRVRDVIDLDTPEGEELRERMADKASKNAPWNNLAALLLEQAAEEGDWR